MSNPPTNPTPPTTTPHREPPVMPRPHGVKAVAHARSGCGLYCGLHLWWRGKASTSTEIAGALGKFARVAPARTSCVSRVCVRARIHVGGDWAFARNDAREHIPTADKVGYRRSRPTPESPYPALSRPLRTHSHAISPNPPADWWPSAPSQWPRENPWSAARGSSLA